MIKQSKKFMVLLALLLIITVLTACSNKSAIFGTWQDASGAKIEFMHGDEQDLVMATDADGLMSPGIYSFPDRNHLYIALLAPSTTPTVYKYEIKDNILVLTTPSGEVTEYKKQK